MNTSVAMPKRFKEACYYAVRESVNTYLGSKPNPNRIDEKMDFLIRAGIIYFEQTPDGKRPPLCLVEVEALADAALRRGIHGKYYKKP